MRQMKTLPGAFEWPPRPLQRVKEVHLWYTMASN
jgi:hypothetical protein